MKLSITYSYLKFFVLPVAQGFVVLTLTSSPHTIFLLTSYSYSFSNFHFSSTPVLPLMAFLRMLWFYRALYMIIYLILSYHIICPLIDKLSLCFTFFIFIIKHNKTLIHINHISKSMTDAMCSHPNTNGMLQTSRRGRIICKYDL